MYHLHLFFNVKFAVLLLCLKSKYLVAQKLLFLLSLNYIDNIKLRTNNKKYHSKLDLESIKNQKKQEENLPAFYINY